VLGSLLVCEQFVADEAFADVSILSQEGLANLIIVI
jgi:hypothetical protein